jgi:succinate dehydrogenase / fumarate reductase flavoprotein subunit
VFGKRAGDYAAAFAKENPKTSVDPITVERAAREALDPFGRTPGKAEDGPYQIQYRLQDLMQDLVGIVRVEEEMARAIGEIATLKELAARAPVLGNREYNPGWHTALDLHSLLTVSEAVARAALVRKESRGAHFRDDFPEKDAVWGKQNTVISKGADGAMELRQVPVPEVPAEFRSIIEEMK